MKYKSKKRGRPKLGKQNRIHCSIRIEPRWKQYLTKKCGSLQKWVDEEIDRLDQIEQTGSEFNP